MRTVTISLTLVVLLFAGCGGRSDDPVISVDAKDEKMNAAIAHAQSTVEGFVERLQNPKPTDEGFSVKKKIEDGDDVEHFWLSDISYSNGTFTGLIGNDPQSVRNVKFGQRIQVNSTEITDWMYLDKGKLVGNFTLRVLLDHMPEEQAKEIREQFQIDE